MNSNTNGDNKSTEEVKLCPNCRTEVGENSVDPGYTIRRKGLITFGVLGFTGLVLIVKWYFFGGEYAMVLLGVVALACACTALLPTLSLAAWMTSVWKCNKMKRLQRFPEDELSNSAKGSLPGWITFWWLLSGIGVFGVFAILFLNRHSELVFVLSESNWIDIDALGIGVYMGFSATVFESLTILWGFCLKNQLRRAEEVKVFVESKIRGNWEDWAATQINHLIADMVPVPGTSVSMGKFEVTQGQWEAVMGSNPASFKGDGFPVETISWEDCQKFCSKLNDSPVVTAAGIVFRLPTEKEWEYACRAGSKGEYGRLVDGTDITRETIGEVAWFDKNSAQRTHAVGQKKQNAFGLFDMHGNVWEWTSTADGEHYICRGGSWASSVDSFASLPRVSNSPRYRCELIGFRLCAEATTK